MADDPTKTGKADRDRINIGQEHELYGWAQTFGVKPADVIAAVKAVGPMVDDVRRHLGK